MSNNTPQPLDENTTSRLKNLIKNGLNEQGDSPEDAELVADLVAKSIYAINCLPLIVSALQSIEQKLKTLTITS